MANKLRLFTKRFFKLCNIAVAVVFLLSCLVPGLHPQKWWMISFLGLVFPFLLFILIIFMAGWFIVLKPKLAIISGVALLVGIKSIGVFIAFHKPRTFVSKK